jgi:hypothetical protein
VARPAENPEDLYLVRAIPNDDVCLFVKDIDNTRVVRKVDQVAPKRCLKTIAGFCGAAALLILLLLPGAYSLLAGYEIQNLREKRQQLLIERAGLELEEARLTSPERLEELAKVQDFIDPAPDKIIYLPPTQGSLALNLPQQ